MIYRQQTGRRRGAVLVLVTLCTVALISLLALAIDIGMVAIARTQCQNAADAAAMAGARTINGNESNNYNYSAVPGNAIAAAVANQVLGKNVEGDPKGYTAVNSYTYKSGQVTVECGAYAYYYDDNNPKNEGFKIQIPRTDTTEPYSAARTTVVAQGGFFFGRIFGLNTYNASATATAVHRPRDVVIVMDLSGSMRFQSLPGTPMSSSGSTAQPSSTSRPRVKSLNPETVYPQFGHYSATSSAALMGNTSVSTGDEMVDPANLSCSSNSGPPILADFYQNAAGVPPGSGNVAFSRTPDSQANIPGGDNYLVLPANPCIGTCQCGPGFYS